MTDTDYTGLNAETLLDHFEALAARLGEPSYRGNLYVYGQRPRPGQPLVPVFKIKDRLVSREEALAYLKEVTDD